MCGNRRRDQRHDRRHDGEGDRGEQYFAAYAHGGHNSASGGLDERRREFIRHALTFALVIGGLALLNLSTTPHAPWFLWPLFGWGLGVVKHGLAVGWPGRALAPADPPIAPPTTPAETTPEREWPDLE